MKLVPQIGYDVKDGFFSYIFFDENRYNLNFGQPEEISEHHLQQYKTSKPECRGGANGEGAGGLQPPLPQDFCQKMKK